MKEKYVAFNILSMVGQDSTFEQLSKSMEPEELEKAIGHKYFKREGTPGNYKYYYTEEQYKKEKGSTQEPKKETAEEKKSESPKSSSSKSWGIEIGQEVKIPANLTSDPLKKQGELGKVLSIDKDIITIKFSDGKSGKYFRDIFEEKEREGSKPTDIIKKDGKRYKLQSNGKYMEVSEHGLTRREHEVHYDKLKEGATKFNDSNSQFYKDHINAANESLETSKKLSDKEYTKEELEKK